MSRTLPTTRVRPVATSTDNPVRQLPSSPRCCSNFAFNTPSSPSSTIRRLRRSSSTRFDTLLVNILSSCHSCLRRRCGSTSLQSSSQSICSRYRRVTSAAAVSALGSIRKLPPGSIIPSRIVAELSHALFDIIQLCTQCRIRICGSCGSRQFQLVLFNQHSSKEVCPSS